MIDLTSEALLTLREASLRIPGKPHTSTLHRWVKYGLRGVILESCLVGGRRVTSIEAVDKFSKAITSEVARKNLTPLNCRPEHSRKVEADLENAGL